MVSQGISRHYLAIAVWQACLDLIGKRNNAASRGVENLPRPWPDLYIAIKRETWLEKLISFLFPRDQRGYSEDARGMQGFSCVTSSL